MRDLLGVGVVTFDPDPARRARLLAASSAFLRLRPWIVAPVMLLAIGALHAAPGVPAAQRRALSVGFAVMLTFFAYEARRVRRSSLREGELLGSMLFTQAGIGLASLLSGGAVAPLLLAPTVVGVAAFGRGRRSALLLATAGAALLGSALIPAGVPFPPLPPPVMRALVVVSAGAAAALASAGAVALGEAYTAARAEADQARAEALEEAASRGRALALLGAQVAHEIKNPLAAVQGLVELLAEDAAGDAKAARRLSIVAGEVTRIERIVTEYLACARPLGATEPTRVDLAALSRDAAALVEGRARRTGARLEVDAPAPLLARVDPRRIKEALINLLLNAVESGASRVRLQARAAGQEAELSVEDDGRGMSAPALASLGRPFYTTREDGTGLGVVLARRAAEQHGGSLRHESEEGRGTTATLRLPRGEGAS